MIVGDWRSAFQSPFPLQKAQKISTLPLTGESGEEIIFASLFLNQIPNHSHAFGTGGGGSGTAVAIVISVDYLHVPH